MWCVISWRYKNQEVTYTRQLDTTVTAFRGSSSLLEVQGSQLATGGLDDPGRVGGRVVSVLMN